MKTNNTTRMLFAVVAAVVLAAISGCQESPVTTPVASPEPSLLTKPHPTCDVIPLEGMLRIPGRPSTTLASIKGQVQYSFLSMPYRGAYRIDLGLSANATIVPEGERGAIWNVVGESRDQLFVSEEGIVILEKYYAVAGARDRLILHVQFLLTSDGIGLSGMWLEKPRVVSAEVQCD